MKEKSQGLFLDQSRRLDISTIGVIFRNPQDNVNEDGSRYWEDKHPITEKPVTVFQSQTPMSPASQPKLP